MKRPHRVVAPSPTLLQRGARCAIVAASLIVVPLAALAQTSPFMTGATALQANILILRCAGSENGGTSQFASRLIGDREVRRRQTARSRDHSGGLGSSGSRRSTNISDQTVVEAAVLASEIERLPDGHGYLKLASSPVWREARLRAGAC